MKKYNLSEIMTRAWAIRKQTNCSMSVALTKSWTIAKVPAKTIETLTREELETLGGKYWEGGSHKRVYFNKAELIAILKIDVEFYKTGNIAYFEIDGEKLSNSYGRELMATVNAGVYYDLVAHKFDSRAILRGTNRIIDTLKEKLLAA